MIRVQDSTPAVYYDKSRDFQFIGRLYDIVLNSLKTESSNLYNLPIGRNMDEKLLNLLAYTLGFQSKHNYNSKQLAALCSVLPLVLRNKGSMGSITTAVNALLSAEGITQSLDYSLDPKKSITLYLSQYLSDLNLLKDLLVYILPAGMGCSLVKEISEVIPVETNLGIQNRATYYVVKDEDRHILRADEMGAFTSAYEYIYQYKGIKNTYEDLPETGMVAGDVYEINTAHTNPTIPAGSFVVYTTSNTWEIVAPEKVWNTKVNTSGGALMNAMITNQGTKKNNN